MCYLLKLLLVLTLYIYIYVCRENKLLSSLYTRRIITEFLEGGLLKLMPKILKSGALRTITNITS